MSAYLRPALVANTTSFFPTVRRTNSGEFCWGGNITSENIGVKHFMNVTWVSVPIPEDKPSEEEIFGRFYKSEVFLAAKA